MRLDFQNVWLAMPRLQSELRRVLQSVETECWDAWLGKWPLAKRIAIARSMIEDDVLPGLVKAMVKRESGHDVPTRARLIQMYFNLATQESFAREFYAMQKACTSLFQRYLLGHGIRVTFASAMDSVALGTWLSDVLTDLPHGAWYHERDGKNWDSTISAAHIALKLAVYEAHSSGLREFAERCVDVVGSLRSISGVLKYRVRGTTKSGHNDTTLGNSLINAFVTYEAMVRCGLRGDIIVAGDDLLAVIDTDFELDALRDCESAFGIIPVSRKFHHYSQVSFISGVWFRSGASFLFTPKPGRLLSRLYWTTSPPSRRQFNDWKYSVFMGLWPVCRHLPIVRALLFANFVHGRRIPVAKVELYRNDPGVVSNLAVAEDFLRRYSITPSEVVDAEHHLLLYGASAGILVHPVLTRIVEFDLADCLSRPIEAPTTHRFTPSVYQSVTSAP